MLQHFLKCNCTLLLYNDTDFLFLSLVSSMAVGSNGYNPDFRNALWTKVKVGILRPVQQPGSYWDRSSELPLVGLEPTEVTAYD